MKLHTVDFKNQIKELGRELDSIITYEINGVTSTISSEELNSVTPHYNANILKSVMKQLDIDSNVDIPKNAIVNYKFGLKINGNYEYIDFGKYVVYKSEKSEDNKCYRITCYDKMLYSMIDYVSLNITYPITVRDYLNAICENLGIVFANKNDIFANYNRIISKELYMDSDGMSLGYKFRDVLDELAQVTASTICINENDELEIRYINNTGDTIDEEYFKSSNVNFGKKYGPINSIVLSRSVKSDNIYMKDEESVAKNGLCELKIQDNQIMNWNDRDTYLLDIFSKLNGLEYYVNDYSSNGICYYDLCDKYEAIIDNQTYQCVMLNDEVMVTQGLGENVYTEFPEVSETDYSKADKTDMNKNQTFLIVDKQNQIINAFVSQTNQKLENTENKLSNQINSVQAQINSNEASITVVKETIENGVSKVRTEKGYTFGDDGLNIDNPNAKVRNRLDETGMEILDKSNNEALLFAGYDEELQETIVRSKNMTVEKYLTIPHARFEEYNNPKFGEGTGCFYV